MKTTCLSTAWILAALTSLIIVGGRASLLTAQENERFPQTSQDAMWGYRSPALYRIIPRPATHANKDESNTATVQPVVIESKPAAPYAYGWFGTKPSPQWYRQFGHQKAYTQWTLR